MPPVRACPVSRTKKVSPMRKRIAIILAALTVALLGFGVSAAQAYVNGITKPHAIGVAYSESGQSDHQYSGKFRDGGSADGKCVEMQRKTSGGTWTNQSFYRNASGTDPFPNGGVAITCTSATWLDWAISVGAFNNIYGLRMHVVNSSPVETWEFCGSQADCQDLGDLIS